MYYQNFDTKITEKYGIIIKGWPLGQFCCPSDVKSRVELEVLFNAWKSGTAHFYKLSQQEYDEWLQRSLTPTPMIIDSASALHDTNPGDGTNPGDVNSSSTAISANPAIPEQVMPPTLQAVPTTAPGPLALNFVNMGVSGGDGTFVAVTKKVRQPRRDKGVPRGKRGVKRGVNSNTENIA